MPENEIELTDYEQRILDSAERAIGHAIAQRDGAISMIFARAGVEPRPIAAAERGKLVLAQKDDSNGKRRIVVAPSLRG